MLTANHRAISFSFPASSNLEILYNLNQQDSGPQKWHHVTALSSISLGKSYSSAVIGQLNQEVVCNP